MLLFKPGKPYVWTINGKLKTARMGQTLIHEHFLVDFIGADKISPNRWNRAAVVEKVLPFLLEARARGIRTILDCTPNFLGRDVQLLQILAEKSGVHLLTNTGYYAAVQYKYLPASAFLETAEQIAARWVDEAQNGIEGTSIRPGFMKIAVNGGHLSEIEQKIVTAAGLTHLETGLTICSHTGPALAAFEQVEVLKKTGVKPDAFVWTHAQNEPDKSTYLIAARMGVWVSLDGIGWGDFENYADWLVMLKANGCLHRVLISHDAGWYDPAKAAGGPITGYTNIFDKLIPLLIAKGFKPSDIAQLLVQNPAAAFAIRVRPF